ncbi:hypothetical protein HPULCUR_010257 [Helicostylum pulchrum]|uniref:Uncharacterized protein n=1 Tax=Helicostylum pulchrum TaxID=562976 RepID=A0ABP9YCQ4_9FUNG
MAPRTNIFSTIEKQISQMSDQISSLEGKYSSMMNALILLIDSVRNLEKLVSKNQNQDEDVELVGRPRTILDEDARDQESHNSIDQDFFW